MTKEKCIDALDHIVNCNTDEDSSIKYKDDIDILLMLIKEHFNPNPYNYTELKEGMWVWIGM